jgi:hypothetical protein
MPAYLAVSRGATRAGAGAASARGTCRGSGVLRARPAAARVPCQDSAEPIACDATAGRDLDMVAGSGTMKRWEGERAAPLNCVRGQPCCSAG